MNAPGYLGYDGLPSYMAQLASELGVGPSSFNPVLSSAPAYQASYDFAPVYGFTPSYSSSFIPAASAPAQSLSKSKSKKPTGPYNFILS